MAGHEKRFDIQLMRGVAVLAVVIFHALGKVVPKGFLGVDVFFVISGFLITGMILRQLNEQRFSFLGFYARRARRLLPASLATLTVTTVLAALILTRADYAAYAKQLLGALTFTSNFAIAQQTGYFDGAAQFKPLLHIWSLSLEEQFYFLAPLLLWFTPLRARPWLLAAATIASLVLCFWGGSMFFLPERLRVMAVTLAYFMLPSRAWELLLGGLAAWMMQRKPDLAIPAWSKFVALAVIGFTFMMGVSPKQPGPDALIASLATVVVLTGRDGWLPLNLLTRAVARVGDWSYSVYLVHWPLISFAFILYLGEPPLPLLIALALLSLVLGWAQYRFVEQPFLDKAKMPAARLWLIAGGATLALAVVGLALWKADRQDPNNQPINGLAQNCEHGSDAWVDQPECRTGANPTVLLWGDSHAMHLVPGLVDVLSTAYPMEQATFHGCAPALGYRATSEASPEVSQLCRDFNARVAAHLRDAPTIRYVIVSGSYENVLYEGDISRPHAPPSQAGLAALRATLVAIRSAGKVPILIGPSPRADFDVGACTARVLTARMVAGHANCDFPRDRMTMRTVDEVDAAVTALGRELHIVVLRPIDTLCTKPSCASLGEGLAIYHDTAHLTLSGSRYLIARLGVRQLLDNLEKARTVPSAPAR